MHGLTGNGFIQLLAVAGDGGFENGIAERSLYSFATVSASQQFADEGVREDLQSVMVCQSPACDAP